MRAKHQRQAQDLHRQRHQHKANLGRPGGNNAMAARTMIHPPTSKTKPIGFMVKIWFIIATPA